MTASAPPTSSATHPEVIAPLLLDYYDAHARRLPWRAIPGDPPPDPYRVWLSEVMLQQTTVAAVIPYFEKFTRRWPDVEALAAAPEEDVMAAWAGLGYYSRARNLVACARAVAERGGFPEEEAELLKLPGLGAYTAAAVAAIAFGKRAVVVDANVERVVSRLFAISTPLPSARKEIRQATCRIVPDERAGDFAQALMDLGATICTTREPRCLLCPLAQHCRGRATGDPAFFPVKPPKKAKPVRQGTAYWMERGGAVWLVTRPGKGMLGGMRALPDDGWKASASGDRAAPVPGKWRECGSVRHVFTHFALELDVLASAGEPASDPTGAGEWWPLDRLEEAGLPTLFARAAAMAIANRSEPFMPD
ncbi:A/G-specific adenine glycosylase [Altererythrobacter sp. SALINAS58]|uniref:A/G-specific adenine glycosylase n=1 Tax=Alteripontixanthobacter muriae TaxID=2705546 RepID=UPI001577586F|nr:A/G-specific adenine glycosylase [Alteripontixanthobacter muriae]